MKNLASKTKGKNTHGRHLNLTFGLNLHVNAHVGIQMFTCFSYMWGTCEYLYIYMCLYLYTCMYTNTQMLTHSPYMHVYHITHVKQMLFICPSASLYLIPSVWFLGHLLVLKHLIWMSVFRKTQAKTLAEHAGFKFTSSCFPLLSVAYFSGDFSSPLLPLI